MPAEKQITCSSIRHIKVIYESKQFIVINKPAGVVMHAGIKVLRPTVVDWLYIYFRAHHIRIFNDRCGLVHRLDCGTSGLCLIAKDPQTFATLKSLFCSRKIKKTYIGFVHDNPLYHAGQIIHISSPIQRIPGSAYYENKSGFVNKIAKSCFKFVSKHNNFFWTEITIKTGRTHQIRVHLQLLKMAIINDEIYQQNYSKKIKPRTSYNGNYLHAWKLKFSLVTNNTKNYFQFTASIPTAFWHLWKITKIKEPSKIDE